MSKISWSAKAHAYVARDPARPGVLARGATLAEAARELAAAVEPQVGKPLLDAVDAIQREVTCKRLRISGKEIAADRALRAAVSIRATFLYDTRMLAEYRAVWSRPKFRAAIAPPMRTVGLRPHRT
jgi:hypothetical protein